MSTHAATTPPLLRSTTVAVPVEHAFDVFTRRIGDWWPLATHGCYGEETAGVAFEGERLVERSTGGEEAVWGEVLAWEPPHRLVYTWHPGYAEGAPATEVEVRFRPSGASTVVELEHRGWERLGERAVEARTDYGSGWPTVLARFAAATEPA
jgi:uncharacterized protein YndB with AHSA1/START domain